MKVNVKDEIANPVMWFTLGFVVVLALGADAAPSAVPPVVNINSASSSQIALLPHVGAVLAARVVDWRTQHGPFHQATDIRQVKGFGDKTVARVIPFVTLSGPTTATRKITTCQPGETGAQCQSRVGASREVIQYPNGQLVVESKARS